VSSILVTELKTMGDSNSILGSIAKSASSASSRQILRYYLQSQSRTLLPQERVAQCHRALAPLRSHVEIFSQPDVKRAWYRNLVKCARLWQCPVCAAAISEVRRKDITEGMGRISERSALNTYTLQHYSNDKLEVILKALLEAYRALHAGEWWQNFCEEFGWIGSIKALEVTYGANGWHPHLHEICFVEPNLELEDFTRMHDQLAAQWRKVLQKQKCDASFQFGMTVKPTYSDVSEYIAKYGHDPVDDTWSAARELAKASSKRASADGKTPFQMLYDFGQGNKRAGELFIEYTIVFKGKQQLVWSNGLRKYMNFTDPGLADDEAADQIPPGAILLARLSQEQWRVILKKDLRGELLEVAAKGDVEGLWDWLDRRGVRMTVEVNATDYMWEQYEKIHGWETKNKETKKTDVR
jgi:hypothetical protein